MPEAHSKYSASKSKILLNCAGSLPLSRGIPNRSSKYSREGTAAHTVAGWALEESKDAAAYIGRRVPVEHETFEVDADMAGHLQVYTDLVTTLRDTLGATLLVEQRLDYGPYILAGTEEEGQEVAWGTGDAVLIAGEEIIVCDLKYGRGEEVDATENSQLMSYALGALQKFGDYGEFKRVRCLISQPRTSKTASEWTCSVEDLLAFAKTFQQAVIRIERAESTIDSRDDTWDAAYLAAGDHCRWCPAKATCPEYRGRVTATVFDFVPATADEFADAPQVDATQHVKSSGDEWLAAAMAQTDFIEHWIKAIRAEVETRLLAGTPVKGQKLVQGKQGNRAWSDDAEAETLMRDTFRLKVDDMYTKTVISPTAAEKLLKTKSPRRWTKLATLITRADGKLSVAPESDKRPAVSVQPVAEEFDVIPTPDEPSVSEYA